MRITFPRLLMCLLLTGLVAVGAGCGSGSSSDAETAAADTAATTTSEGSAAVSQAAEEVAAFSAVPEFTPPGPAVDVAKAKGKTMFVVPLSSEIPFVDEITKTMEKLAAEVGVKTVVYPNQGQPSQWVAGVQQAISQKADLIVLNLAPDPRVLQPQLAAAKKAGIPVIVTHFFDESAQLPPACDKPSATCVVGATAQVPGPFNKAARAMSSWIINDSGGEANVLVVQSSDAAPSQGMLETIESELGANCPDCATEVKDVRIADWQTKVQGEVQSALLANPDIDYVLPLYDGMAPAAVTAIEAAGKASDVKVVTFNGTPSVMELIQKGTPLKMDVAESTDWQAYAYTDEALRALAGMDLPETQNTPVRIFDTSNIDEAGTPPQANAGFGDAYVQGYRQLWGLEG